MTKYWLELALFVSFWLNAGLIVHSYLNRQAGFAQDDGKTTNSDHFLTRDQLILREIQGQITDLPNVLKSTKPSKPISSTVKSKATRSRSRTRRGKA
jgi:hypothetical protein